MKRDLPFQQADNDKDDSEDQPFVQLQKAWLLRIAPEQVELPSTLKRDLPFQQAEKDKDDSDDQPLALLPKASGRSRSRSRRPSPSLSVTER